MNVYCPVIYWWKLPVKFTMVRYLHPFNRVRTCTFRRNVTAYGHKGSRFRWTAGGVHSGERPHVLLTHNVPSSDVLRKAESIGDRARGGPNSSECYSDKRCYVTAGCARVDPTLPSFFLFFVCSAALSPCLVSPIFLFSLGNNKEYKHVFVLLSELFLRSSSSACKLQHFVT
jgi:hypothetical protein